MENPPFTTKVLLEVEVSHWGTCTPDTVVQMIEGSLAYPAVIGKKIMSVTSNYKLHSDTPLPEFKIIHSLI